MTTYVGQLFYPELIGIKNEMKSAPVARFPKIWSGWRTISAETMIKGTTWKTVKDLAVEVKKEDGKAFAILNNIDEYGIGDSIETAIEDLLISLVDYLMSLEKRSDKLGTNDQSALMSLRGMIVNVS